jgi:CTP:molybdopterin cytidylyltransferase MocA
VGVLGHHAKEIEPVVQTFPVTIVHNPDPDQGQVSSQRLGLAALGGKLDAVIVALADQPLLNAQDITDLISAFKKRPEGSQVVFPSVNGDRGNPVIFTQEVREQILHSGLQVGCRQWQSTHPELVTPFETDNRRYQVDLDTEDDIARFERETGHRLRWPAIA